MENALQHNVKTWTYDNGSIGACFEEHADGVLYGRDTPTFLNALAQLLSAFSQAVKRGIQDQGGTAVLSLTTQGMWIDGRYTVRWLELPGFGVDFANEESCGKWLEMLFNIVARKPTNEA